jgi:hypothetical protein
MKVRKKLYTPLNLSPRKEIMLLRKRIGGFLQHQRVGLKKGKVLPGTPLNLGMSKV